MGSVMMDGSSRRRVRGSRKSPLIFLFLSALLFGVVSVAAAQTILYVDVDAPGPTHNGDSWETAYTDLQDALATAAAGGGRYEIWVAQGTYKPSVPSGRYATFRLLDGVALYGGFVGTEDERDQRDWVFHETLLSGDFGDPEDSTDNSYHVVTGSGTDASAVLDGFSVSYGDAGDGPSGHGGGLYNVAGSPTVAHCTFCYNFAGHGGGMYNGAVSSPTVTHCTFSRNHAKYGGAMCNENSSPTVTDCSFYYNELSDDWCPAGAGMYNVDSSPSVIDCTFYCNGVRSADPATLSKGGGMYNKNCSPTVTDCSFTGNEAYEAGGGVYNQDSSPEVTGCTFTGNEARYGGGGMDNGAGSSPTVTGCVFTGNEAQYGGAMSNYSNSPTVTDCTFSRNTAYGGGGMYNSESSPPITGCTFNSNEADYGGGMHNFDSSPTVTDCTFSNNKAYAGGGIYSSLGSPMVIRCTFTGNEAAAGGGMQNGGSLPMTVTDCTFSDNVASYYGGAMSNAGARPMAVIDCTFSGNSAELGGGMYNYNHCNPAVVSCTFFGNEARRGGGIFGAFTTSTIGNTILAGNSPDDCALPVTSLGYNLESGTSCGCTQPTDQQNTDPLLDPLLRGNGGPTLTHALLPGSPALDAIPPPYNGARDTDQRGFPRPYPPGGFADIGAVEMQRAYSRGDVNGDGAIDLLDVVLCQQIASGLVHGTAEQYWAADMDRDGDVDADDVAFLSEYVLGIRVTQP